MPYYECVYIARQDVPSAQVEGLTETYSNLIAENGGKVEKTEYWGLKTLSYRIKKNRKGHYVLLNIDAPHPAVAEMERQMRISDDVLRILTIKVDALEEGPSAMMQSRAGRDGDPSRAILLYSWADRQTHEFFHPRVRSIGRCGRVVVLGRPARLATNPAMAAA